MGTTELCFWLCALGIFYVFAGYPLLLVAASRLFGTRRRRRHRIPRAVSVVIAAHNEEDYIERRLDELAAHIEAAGLDGEVIVVSDGCTDETVALARAFLKGNVRVLEQPSKAGKAAALNAGCAAAVHDIIVFADARQSWDANALPLLLENFADPEVGAVSGDLVVDSDPGLMAGVGLYWRFEKWLRRQESHAFSTVGVTGAICAVRRTLFQPLPRGIILDDVYWPLRVIMQGYRVVHEHRAHAHDRLPDRTWDEFRRKVRTLSGNFQLLTYLPTALLPWRNRVWFELLSHKLLRLAVPWLLMAAFVLSALLSEPVYQVLFWSQAGLYLMGLAGLWTPLGSRLRPAGAAASFLVLNAAAWLAFWVWISGNSGRSWHKVAYKLPPLEYSDASDRSSAPVHA
jgi:cellulose synthase/poly-beta-1,6-N-acetylglucosamine synthase-like glycosyltransferase